MADQTPGADAGLLRLARWSMWTGALLTTLCLVAGFLFLFADLDDWAKRLLTLVPVGFLIGFTGLVTHIMLAPRSDDGR
jgi:hypothetical protein